MNPAHVTMSVAWFFCLGGLGVFFPFFSLYLHENAGLSGSEVGWVMAVTPLVGIAAQPLWGNVADRTGSRTRVLMLLCLGSAVGYGSLAFASGFTALLLWTAVMACFWSATLPTAVAVTLGLVRDASRHAFGLVRVWGTVGFLVMVVAFPSLLEWYQDRRGLAATDAISEPGLELMFPVTAAAVLVAAVVASLIPRSEAMEVRAPRGDWRRLVRHGPFVRILFFTLGAFLCLRGPMAVFPIFVSQHGGSLDSVSQMWIPMLLTEIPLIALSGATLARFGPRGLLAMGVIAGGARWTICSFAPDLSWVFAVQVLHGVVIAGLVVGAPLYVEAVVPERLRATGQGIMAMLGISVGGATSNLLAGHLLERFGPDAPYLAGGLGAIALGLLVPVILPPATRPPPAADE